MKKKTSFFYPWSQACKARKLQKITGLTAGNVRQKLSRSLAKMKNNLVQKEGAYV